MDFELALATVMQRIMSESLFPGTSPEQHQAVEAVRLALLKAWPEEVKQSRNCITFVPDPQGGVQAVLNYGGLKMVCDPTLPDNTAEFQHTDGRVDRFNFESN